MKYPATDIRVVRFLTAATRPARLLPFVLAAFLAATGFQTTADYVKLHRDALVIDTHNDVVHRILAGEDISRRTPRGHSDLPRFIEGGLDVEFFSIWVPPANTRKPYLAQADEQIDSVLSFVRRNPGQTAFASSAADVIRYVSQGKFVAMLGLEGGHPIGNDLANIDHFSRRGVRYITLTWNNSTSWATSAEDEHKNHLAHKGLTEFGRRVVRRMNDRGMIVDVSHTGPQTFWDVLHTTRKPVIASHSSAWALCHHWRNLTDDQLKAIARNGGVVCVNFAPFFIDSTFAGREARMKTRNKSRIAAFEKTLKGDAISREMAVEEFLTPEYDSIRPPLSCLVDHIDYIARLIGADHVGLGSDFDGISVTPKEMDDVTCLPNITRELLRRGYNEKDIRLILGENVLRVLRENERKI